MATGQEDMKSGFEAAVVETIAKAVEEAVEEAADLGSSDERG